MIQFPYKTLISKAEKDYLTAKIVLESNHPLFDIICFHLQQCVEKYLKALLLFNQIDAIRTHSIPFLLSKVIDIDKSFEKYQSSRINKLNSCGVDIRYDDLDDIDSDFVIQSFNDVAEFIEFTSKKFC